MARASVREQLMESGLQMLHLHGFNGCAVQDITSAAGVPKGSFYNHFESKEALAQEALLRYWEEGAERRALLGDAKTDPVERLRRYFRALADIVADNHFQTGCLIGNFSTERAAHSEETRETLSKLFAAWTRTIELCVQDAKAAKRVRLDLPAGELATFLLNAWEGAVLRSKVEQDRAPLDQFLTVVFKSLFV